MNEQIEGKNNNAAHQEAEDSKSRHCCKHRHGHRRCRFGRGIFFVVLIIGMVWAVGAALGHHHHSDWHDFGHGWSQSGVTERLDRMTDRLIDEVDASDQQEDQIRAIARNYTPRLESLKAEHLNNRDAIARLLSQQQVDRQPMGQIRQNELATLDAASSELLQMIADISDVLSYEQRQQLVDGLSRRGYWR
ncbi:MAG: hypothetical protein CO186_01065 [Zetaproteobacteria bacterium CG_4_9_14_3_um_filter_49_83]|nr:MAG: hypothetical protein AUJ56_02395 [Zetaproteobacteria bacterium CG1_02_49_23]PIQ30049.1 MAG: hypothetical protein COW62_13640 [Zetaproteobacteria bacterium CG17_big_fil_post_rev_8_21_14_2_50_50_13]PIV29209.1 MAG: hypothetical protein COS35_13290 [Zetaproteobacteria bacterium CG02_land_8_20_14_3_00_50_9]PIY56003.1 MAG: hypothetical protein COZ00_06635 [Zetaproteobacteria bacterium CG_4_10_14_0_8_um_filter_49_80]PJA36321.1 MAG: hypothetical protein CO186_01065 [Zetaproteobacteria bacterium